MVPALQVIRERFRSLLFDEFFPFWDRFGVDHENGGVFCSLDFDGTRVSEEKYMWYQGRSLWIYAHAYRRHGKDPRFLEIARKTYDFLLRSGRDADGYWRRAVGPNGEPAEGADPMGFAGIFVAEGMQELARATDEAAALNNALAAYRLTRTLFDSPSRYVQPDYLPVHYPGIRLLGHEMVCIRFLTQVLRHNEDPHLRRELQEAVTHVLESFFHPVHRLTSEALDPDYRRPDDANDDFFVLGHGMETMWMIMDAAEMLGDEGLFALAAERFRTHSKASWDAEKNGFMTALSLSKGPLPGRLLWHYDEALIGNLMLYAKTGSREALDAFLHIEQLTTKCFHIEGKAGPVWAICADDAHTPPARTDRMGNYHVPRRLMLCLELFDSIDRKSPFRDNGSI